MRLRTIVKLVGILLVALVVAAVAFVLNLDPNDHTDRIAKLVEEKTGRKIAFGGPIELDLGLTTSLAVRDVSFSNATWGSRTDMATVGLVEMDVRLLPLIVGSVDIGSIILRDVDVLVETDAQGRSNLDFGQSEEPAGEDDGDGDLDVGVGQLDIRNIQVTIIDEITKRTTVARLDRAVAVPAIPGAPLDVDIKGTLTLGENVARVALDGQVGSSKAILSSDAPVPVNLKGTVLGYDVLIEGGVRQPEAPDDVNIMISVVGDGLKALQPFVQTPLPKLGPIELKAHITGDPSAPVVEDIRITAAQTVISGRIDIDDDETSYNLKAVLNDQDLGLIAPYVDMPLAELGPLRGSVNIIGDLDTLRLEPNAVGLDKSKLSGSVTVALQGGSPKLNYDVVLTLDGQTMEIAKPFVVSELPALGPIHGTIRAVGDRKKVRIEISDLAADRSTISGQVDVAALDATPTAEFDVTLNADAQSLKIIQPYITGDISGLGVVDGGVRATGTLDKAALTLTDVVVDKSRISGRIDVDRSGGETKATYDVALVANQQKLDILGSLAGLNLTELGPVDVTTSLTGDAKQARFENLSLRFSDSQLSGGGQVDLSGEVPRVSAKFESSKFDLTRFVPDIAEARKPELMSKEAAQQKAAKNKKAEPVFPSDPLPFDFLNAVQADISLKIGTFITPYGTYDDFDVRVVVGGRSLNIRPFSTNYAGKPLTGNVSVDGGGGLPKLAISMSGPKIAVGQVFRDFADLDVLEGEGALNIAVNGSGRSVADIMGSLNGHARILMAQGRMRNEGLGYVSGVFSSIGEILGKKEWVVVECLASDFQIANGIATSKVGVLNTEVISLAVSGDIDLKQERFNLKTKPLPRGLDLSLAVPVNVTGPLSDPGFSPDAIGTLTKLGGILGAVIFPPAALIGLTELGGNDHPCVQFAKESDANPDATPSSPLEKKSSGGVLNVPGRVLDGVGNGLKGVIGR